MNIFNSNAILILYDKVCSNLTRPKIKKKTRIHSSNIRTARSLTVSHSIRGGIFPTHLDADPPDADPLLDVDLPWMQTPPRGQTNTSENIITLANFVCGW